MKVYIDFSKQAITKVTSQTSYEGDFESIVFELLFFNYNNTNWYPTMSQLAPNGREAGDFTADEAGTEIVEDGITYLKFEFTLGTGWVSIKGISNFFIWNNQFVNGTLTKKCIGKITLRLNESTNGYFVFDPYLNPSVAAFMRELMEGVAHPAGVYTNSQIADLQEDIGIVVSSTDGYWYYWDVTTNEYVQGALYQAPFYTSVNKLNSDYVDDTNSTHKFVTASEKAQIGTNATNITELQNYKADRSNSSQTIKANKTIVNKVISLYDTTAFIEFEQEAGFVISTPNDDFFVNSQTGGIVGRDTYNGTYYAFRLEEGKFNITGTGIHYYENGNQMATQTYVDSTTGHTIELSLDSTNYMITAVLKNSSGTVISTSSPIDLPLESVVVSGAYDDTTKKVVLTLQNGSTIDFSVADLISGLQTEITAQNKLSSDLVDDTNATNKFVTASEKTQIATNTTAIANTYTKAETNTLLSEKADLNNSSQNFVANTTTANTLIAKTGFVVGSAFSTEGYVGIEKDENSDKYQLFRYKSGTTTKIDIPEKTGTMALTSDIVANPTLAGTEADLTGLEVNGVKYAVPSGSGGGTTLDDIVDSQGNKRFIEGNGTPATISGATFSYCKWSLSGTHLMLVLAGTVDNGTTIPTLSKLATFTLPTWILNKIYPVWDNAYTEIKLIPMYNNVGATQDQLITLKKNSTTLEMITMSSVSYNAIRGFRVQFDLLIDAS